MQPRTMRSAPASTSGAHAVSHNAKRHVRKLLLQPLVERVDVVDGVLPAVLRAEIDGRGASGEGFAVAEVYHAGYGG